MTQRINPTSDRARGNAKKQTTIANGATTSEDVDLSGFTLAGVLIPVAMTGSTLTFQGTVDKVNYYDIKNTAGTAISITLSTTGIYKLNAADFIGIDNLRIVIASAEGALRTITVIGADILNG